MKNPIAANIEKNHNKLIRILIFTGLVIFGYGFFSLANPYILIRWSTASEVDTLGFNIIREEFQSENSKTKINDDLIFAQGSPISGFDYQFRDNSVRLRKEYSYSLQEVNYDGEETELERISISAKPEGIPTMIIGMVMVTYPLLKKISI